MLVDVDDDNSGVEWAYTIAISAGAPVMIDLYNEDENSTHVIGLS